MKYPIIFLLIILTTIKGFSQNTPDYTKLISEGWKLCLEKDYTGSAKFYEKAFKLNSKVPLSDRYNASCIYALANNKDMAFHHLFIIGNDLKWSNYDHLINDTDLTNLHNDSRWQKLSSLLIKNKKEEAAHFDKDMVAVLDQIYFDDQSTRHKIRSTEEKYGRESREIDILWQDILRRDSINLIKVSKILDEKG